MGVGLRRVGTFLGLAVLGAFAVLVFSGKRKGDWDRQVRDFAWSPERQPFIDPNPPEELLITVGDGDSFWSIAEQLVGYQLGRTPVDDEVIEPWLALIDANLDRLVEPENPDLLHPGQVLRLPPG